MCFLVAHKIVKALLSSCCFLCVICDKICMIFWVAFMRELRKNLPMMQGAPRLQAAPGGADIFCLERHGGCKRTEGSKPLMLDERALVFLTTGSGWRLQKGRNSLHQLHITRKFVYICVIRVHSILFC